MKVFVIDVELCVGCYACQFVCKDEHVGNDWSPIAKPQPDTGQFWVRLDEHIRGTVPKVEMHYIPNLCMHCDEAPCIPPCPVEGAIYQRDDGLVIIDAASMGEPPGAVKIFNLNEILLAGQGYPLRLHSVRLESDLLYANKFLSLPPTIIVAIEAGESTGNEMSAAVRSNLEAYVRATTNAVALLGS